MIMFLIWIIRVTTPGSLFIELVFGLVLLDVVLVAFVEVLRKHDVSVLSDGLHARLPTSTITT